MQDKWKKVAANLLVAASFFILVLFAGEYIEGQIDIMVLTLALMAGLLSFLFIQGYGIYRLSRAETRASELISLAARDEIDAVALVDPTIPTCWKEKNCYIMECPVYGREHVRCWQVEGTFCRGEVPGTFPEKLEYCYECEVFRTAVSDDPVREIEVRFQDMLRVIADREARASDMYEKTELQRQILEFLLNLSRKALSSLEIDALLDLVLKQISGSVADFAAIYMESHEGSLELRAHEGFDEGIYPKLLNEDGEDFVDEVMAHKGLIVNRNLTDEPWFCNQFPGGRCPEALIGLPLECRGRKMGVLVAGTFRQQAFDNTEQQVFQIAGDQISMAVFNADMYESVSRLAATDGLTALANHRSFYESLERELGRAGRYNRPLSLIMIDIDYFKQFNDTYGHPQGDKVLAEIAKLIRDSVRVVDTAARYGGEEFAVLLPETPYASHDAVAGSALHVAERMRKAVEAHWFEGRPGTRDVKITISIGVAEYPSHAAGLAEMVYAADVALYKAKKNGRNRVEVSAAAAGEHKVVESPS